MRVAICDGNEADRLYCRRQIEKLAQKHHLEVEIQLYKKGSELLFHLEDVKKYADIIYLDIGMEGMSGEEVACRLREKGCTSELIFFTASKKYYGFAFDVGAFHYLVKGSVPESKFEEIFLGAVRSAEVKRRGYIMCSGVGGYRNIDIWSIRYFQVVGRIVTVYYDKKKEFNFSSPISRLESRLTDHGFVRVHRAYLVSMAWVKSITCKELLLRSGETIPIGKSYYAALKQSLNEYCVRV